MEGTIRSTETSASPQDVFDVAVDLSAYPEWATGVVEVTVDERDDQGRPALATFVIDGFVKRISYQLEYTYDAPNLMSWTGVPGEDIKDMEGSYEFRESESGGTTIVYALRVAPNFSVPGFLRRQAEKQIVQAALRGLRRRAEERVAKE
jgi:ribosome-associated toxin RatA of RatAB toxin-antitoxin module